MAGSSYNHSDAEQHWGSEWEKNGTYRWDPSKSREETFVIDTPPPTVSGSLHVGHVFSYTQTDVIARFQRMCGKNVFYPIGWDDNGLPTERRVQNYFAIRCDPSLPYDPAWKPVRPEGKDPQVKLVSRRNFIEACAALTEEDEKAFEALWRKLALSYDWTQQYATISKHSIKVSQYSFLDLIKKGELYSTEAPTLWDVDFNTAIAQAELEDREIQGAFHDLRFEIEGGGHFIIATTRPELLASCIAVVAHPDDTRYQSLFGKTAITPLFHAPVPIVPADHAEPEKGTGIMMVCTFGDMMDVAWWKQSRLPIRQTIDRSGRIIPIRFGEGPFESRNAAKANAAFSQLAGLRVKQAQKKVVELLSADGSAADGQSRALIGEPRPVKHAVKFYEKGERPLEIVTSRQWFIRVLDHKEELLEQGRKVEWHPPHMLVRYENWVLGLNQDWCISRQRYFGVPIPVWYPISGDGIVQYSSPIFPDESALPVDPLSDPAPGYREEQRGKPGGFTGDCDVMDTWATSSLTPQLMSHWSIDDVRHHKLFPMDMRPQAHEIIRTWAFCTIAKAWLHEREIPWKHAVISGWILDPDRKKMSKSKGNVVTPSEIIDQYSADGVRYWAARARLGTDTAYDLGVFKIGQKLVIKLLNASRFVLGHFDRIQLDPKTISVNDISEELDVALVAKLRTVIETATAAFEKFDYAAALQAAEEAFWDYCDNYLELVKKRSYLAEDSAARRSAFATLGWSLRTFLRLFAPHIPYVTEELWSSSFAASGRDSSIHTTAWPSVLEVASVRSPKNIEIWSVLSEAVGVVRGTKTSAQKSQKWPLASLRIEAPDELAAALRTVASDLADISNVAPANFTITAPASPLEPNQKCRVTAVLGDKAE